MDLPLKLKVPKSILWDEFDSMSMTWLWSTFLLDISGSFMSLSTTKEIWDLVKQTYLKVKDVALIYKIKTKLNTTK